MADQDYIARINEQGQVFSSFDRSKILRPELGVESLEKNFSPILDELYQKLTIILKVATFVSNSSVQKVVGQLEAINQHLLNLINFSNTDYVANKQSSVAQIISNLDVIRDYWPHFYTALQENFPQNGSDQQQLLEATALTETLREKTKEAEERLNSFNSLLNQAATITEAAQKTAQGVSIKAAQEQFSKAQNNLYVKIIAASIGAIVATYFLFSLSFEYLAQAKDLEDSWSWKIAYHASIRAIILGSIAAISAFFLTLLKAYLHLLEHNLHRQRVANSTEAFVASAQDPQQRDLILGRLVDSVTNFGDSGLLKSSNMESNPASKIAFDISAKS